MNDGEYSKYSIIDFAKEDYTQTGTVKRAGNTFSFGVNSSCTFNKTYLHSQNQSISKLKVMTGLTQFGDNISPYQTELIIRVKISTFNSEGVVIEDAFITDVFVHTSIMEIELDGVSNNISSIEVSLINNLQCLVSVFFFGVYVYVGFEERLNESSTGVIVKELHVIETPESYKIMAVLNNGNNVYYTPRYDNGKLSYIDISHGLGVPVYYGKEV